MTVRRRGPSPAFDKELDRLLDVCRRGRAFLLSGHEHPDGDTIGCELSVAGFLRARGKSVTIANAYPPPPYCRFLPGIRSVRAGRNLRGRWDVAVVFECSSPERMGGVVDLRRQVSTVANVDHHAHHGMFGDINLVDASVSSNAELAWRILRRAGHRPTPGEATALYAGLVTDTGRFQQENTRSGSHRFAADLMDAGADTARACREIYGTRSAPALRLLGRALDSLRLTEGGRVAVLRLTRRDFAETGAEEGETEDIANEGLKPASVTVSVFLRELAGGGVKASLRGKGGVDLGRLAVGLGGGGHRNAAGIELPGGLVRAERTVLGRLRGRPARP